MCVVRCHSETSPVVPLYCTISSLPNIVPDPFLYTRMASTRRKNSAGSTSPSTMAEQDDAGEQHFNKDGTRRKSRVLRRKTDHSIIERRRREKINEKLVSLQNIVPACRKECQDLIERKFTTPLRATDDNQADSYSISTKRNAKRKREEERLDKAKSEMSEKIRTSMVLEKLCIISHTLDFVVKLQEENKALRALCDCQAERRASIHSNVELDEHYRSAHSYDDLEAVTGRDTNRPPAASPSDSSESDSNLQEEPEKPSKRRLHWGSDEVRQASIRNDVCRRICPTHANEEACRRERSLSLTASETACDAISDRKCSASSPPGEIHRASLPCSASSSESGPCNSFCRTRHSCCREEEQGSEASSDASDDLTSPPPPPPACQARGPAMAAANGHGGYLGRPRLPSIVNLGLPRHDSQLASLRHDTFASIYRKEVPRPSDLAAAPRAFRPLSLYTSHAPPPSLSSIKP